MHGEVQMIAYDQWVATHMIQFTNRPKAIVGIGPTRDGKTISENQTDFFAIGGETQKSLLITETPYAQV